MKKNDIASLILIIAISFALAFLLGGMLLRKPQNQSTTIEVVNKFEDRISVPSEIIFSDESINPTEDISIGQSETDRPFAP